MQDNDHAGPIGPHHDEAEWLKARKEGIGASEVAAIMGCHPFMDEREVYFNKVGGEEKTSTRYMERGRVLEAPAAELYSRETGRQLRRMPLVRHKDLPILFATLDRQILAGEDHPTAGLEIKVPAWRSYAKVRKDGLPAHWIYQAQAQHMVTGYPFIAFGILNADAWKMMTHDFQPQPELSQPILDKLGEWWERHIVAGVPPAPKIQEPPKDLPKVDVDTEIHMREDEEWRQIAELYEEATETKKAADALDKMVRDQMKALLRAAGQEVAEGFGLRAYLRTQAGRVSFQAKELKAVKPVDRQALITHLQIEHHLPGSVAQSIAENCELDLSKFEKRGADFETLKAYLLKGDA